jgi:hypothetical protein
MLLPSFLNTRTSADTTTATNAPLALVVSVRMQRRVMGFLTAVGMAAVVVLGTAVPASATVGDMFTVDYITYIVTSQDPATVAATDYNEAGGTTVVIPSTEENAGTTYTVTSIGDHAFEGDPYGSGFALRSVTIPDSVISMGDYVFYNNSLTSVMIPDSVGSIGVYAFAYNLLTSVALPNSVISIGNAAFGYNQLMWVALPDSLISIDHYAFYGNSLTSVTIPNLVTYIGDNAFGGNNSLGSATFAGPAPTFGVYTLGGNPVPVYHYAKYGEDVVGPSGFTTPTWYGNTTYVLPTTALTASLDIDVNIGDTVAGAPVAITADGLLVGSAYSVVVRSTPTTIASGHATNTGTVSDSSGLMPSGLAPGAHTVTFTGTDADGNAVSRVAYLTVSDTGTVTYLSYTAAESLTLAETGFEVAPFAAAALLLLAAGVALTLRRRRVTA